MNIKLLIIPILLVTVLMYGCTTPCNEPYIEYKKGDCCLDSNKNKICDNDENSAIKETSQRDSDQSEQKNTKQLQKEDCQFECCVGNDYKVKICKEGYECKNLKCIELDTDGDGLTDLQEKKLRKRRSLITSLSMHLW